MGMEFNATDTDTGSDADEAPEEEGYPTGVHLIYCITIPLSSLIILSSLFIMAAILRNRRLHTAPNVYFLSLLLADVGVGVSLPFIPWMGLRRPLGSTSCLAVHVLPNFLFLVFLGNLVLVHYERYRHISHPLRHARLWLLRRRRCPLVVLLLWLPPLLFALLPAFGWNNNNNNNNNHLQRTVMRVWTGAASGYSGMALDSSGAVRGNSMESDMADPNCSVGVGSDGGTDAGVGMVMLDDAEFSCTYHQVFPNVYIYLEVYGILAPSILSIAVMTGRVLWITHAQLRHIRQIQRSVTRCHRGGGGGRGTASSERHYRHHRSRLSSGVDLRYARCVAAVSLSFLACWVPYIVYTHVAMAFLLRHHGDIVHGNRTAHIALSCAGIGGMGMVPLLLGVANRQYRHALRRLLGSKHTRPEEATGL